MSLTLTIIGATGSNGRLAVAAALGQGLQVRATSRSLSRARRILGERENLQLIEADGTDLEALTEVLSGVDGVVLAHGKDSAPETVNYNVIATVLRALDRLGQRSTHLSLMSAIAVTQQIPAWSEVLEWRRRGERLIRASGLPYTIIRPGWFDGQGPGDERAVLEQGDRTPLNAMRGVARRHIAGVLVAAVLTDRANYRTVEIFSAPGDPVEDWGLRYAGTDMDPAGSVDGVHDAVGLPLEREPARVVEDLTQLHQSGR